MRSAVRVSDAGEPRERAGEGERQDLDAPHVDAHGGGSNRVVADRPTGAAEGGMIDTAQHPQGQRDEQHQHHRVPGAANRHVEHARQAIVGNAAGPAGEIAALADDDENEQSKGGSGILQRHDLTLICFEYIW